jgi:hypothetical protein
VLATASIASLPQNWAGRAVGQLAEIKEFPSAQVGQQVGQRPTRPAGSVGVAFQ